MKKFLSKDNMRTAVSVILSFVLCIGIFVVSITASVIFSAEKSFVISSVKGSCYTEYAVSELTEKLNDLAIPSGLDETFFSGKIDREEFERLFFECLSNTIERKADYSADVSAFEAQVLKDVTEYSVAEAGELSTETVDSLKAFSKECANIYLTFINPPLLSYILPLFKTVSKYVLWVNIASIVLSAIAGFFLYRLNSRKIFWRFFAASLTGAFLTCAVLPSYLLITDEISRISISAKSLHAVITAYANGFLQNIILFAIPLALCAIIVLIFQIKDLIFKR